MTPTNPRRALSLAVQALKFCLVAWLFYSVGHYQGKRQTFDRISALASLSRYESTPCEYLVLRQCALLPGNRYIDLVIENTGRAPVRDVRAVVACFNFRSNLVDTVPASIDIIPPGVRWDSTLEVDTDQGIKAVQLLSIAGN